MTTDMTGEELQAIRANLADAKRGRTASPERYPADFDWVVEALEEALDERGGIDERDGQGSRTRWPGSAGAVVRSDA